YKIRDPSLHIELRRWADIVLVAPCSENTLSKIIHDSATTPQYTSLLCALAPTTPTYVFLVNTLVYKHPLRAEHLHVIRDACALPSRRTNEKNLACGNIGLDAMIEWCDVVKIVVNKMKLVRKDKQIVELYDISKLVRLRYPQPVLLS
ncbi:hypothetical protein BDR07DRAFT_1295538, partial [Suillus spraguei]